MTNYSKGIYYGATWGRDKKIKEKLVREFGICYWCKKKVHIYNHLPRFERPNDEATLDHLKSRNDGRVKGEVTPKVLACRKCNNEREQGKQTHRPQ